MTQWRTNLGTHSSGCGPTLAFCGLANQVSSVGRQAEERPLTPDQGQGGGNDP